MQPPLPARTAPIALGQAERFYYKDLKSDSALLCKNADLAGFHRRQRRRMAFGSNAGTAPGTDGNLCFRTKRF